jgi:hypothetical protein
VLPETGQGIESPTGPELLQEIDLQTVRMEEETPEWETVTDRDPEMETGLEEVTDPAVEIIISISGTTTI